MDSEKERRTYSLRLCTAFIILSFPFVFVGAMVGVQRRRDVGDCQVIGLESNQTACIHQYTVAIEFHYDQTNSSSNQNSNANEPSLVHCHILSHEELSDDEKCVSKFVVGDNTTCSVTEPPCKNVRFESSWVFVTGRTWPMVLLPICIIWMPSLICPVMYAMLCDCRR